jgi:hypothetical protein
MSPDRKFYVYAHYRESDGRIFYVGKGCGKRAHSSQGRSEYWHRISAKHRRSVKKLRDCLPEACAFSLEKALIAIHKENLCNATDGGEGATGLKRTTEWRSAMSIRVSGENNPMFGRREPLSEEHKAKIGLANRKPKPKGFGDAVSKRMAGVALTEEQKEKRRIAMIGKHAGSKNPMHGKRGVLCPRYDSRVYKIVHPDMGTLIARQSKLSSVVGPLIYKLVRGKKQKYKGWTLA